MKTLASLALAAALTATTALTAFAAEPLVDAAWLKSNLGQVKVIDLRSKISNSDEATFRAGHIPGAVYSNYGTDGWRVKGADGTPGVLPSEAELEALFGRLGITPQDHVVLVSAGKSSTDLGSATRAFWTLKTAGHDEVSVLNGGYDGWVAAGGKVETGLTTPPRTTYDATIDPRYLATKQDVVRAKEDGTALIDNRIAPQFTGEKKADVAARYGTIPGAQSVPQDTLTVGGNGTFKSAEELKALYAKADPAAKDEINFCNTGHWASMGWFVSSQLLGNDKAKMYDGSMAEYSADRKLPLETKVKPSDG